VYDISLRKLLHSMGIMEDRDIVENICRGVLPKAFSVAWGLDKWKMTKWGENQTYQNCFDRLRLVLERFKRIEQRTSPTREFNWKEDKICIGYQK
jgi:hypothetical protein